MVETPEGHAPVAGALVRTSTGSSRTRGASCRRSRSWSSTRRSTRPTRRPTTGARSRARCSSAARTMTASSSCTGPTRWPTPPRRSRSCCPASAARSSSPAPRSRSARTRSDGRQNFVGALQVAARSDVDEVTLLFGEVLLRGNRATKMDASGLDAFDSPRFPPLADIGIDIVVRRDLVRPPEESPRLTAGRLGHVAAMRLFPGFSASILANLCRPPLQGLVIEAYGAGNGPAERPGLPGGDRGRRRAGHRRGGRHPVRPRIGAAWGVRDGLGAAARGRGAGLRHDVAKPR